MTESEPSAPPPMGLLARIIGVITSPRATFERVVANPRPFGALFVTALVLGLAQVLPQLDADVRQATVDMQAQVIERMTNQPISPEMYANMERQAASPFALVFGIISQLVFLPIVTLLITAILWAIFNAVLGGLASFKQVLAVVAHSQVIWALSMVIAAPIHVLQGSMSPGGPFNLGVLAPMLEEGSVIRSFLEYNNVFTIWWVIVLAIGLGVLYRRKTTSIAIGLGIAWAAIGLGIAAAFQGLFGRN